MTLPCSRRQELCVSRQAHAPSVDHHDTAVKRSLLGERLLFTFRDSVSLTALMEEMHG